MQIVKPFYAYRYSDTFKDKIAEVICPPYDLIDKEKQMELFKIPYNYVRIVISPFGHDDASRTLKKFIDEGIFVRDNREKIYILRQNFKIGNVEGYTVGMIALVSKDAKILVHERTKPKVIQDRIELLEKTGFNTCAIMLISKNTNIKSWAEKAKKEKIFDFSYFSDDFEVNINAELYSTEDFSILGEFDSFFIADGHHRFEAIKKVYSEKGEKYFMAYITDENSGIKVFPILREIRNSDVIGRIKKFSESIFTLKTNNLEDISEWIRIFEENRFDCIIISDTEVFKVIFSKNSEKNILGFIHDYILKDLEVEFEHSVLKSIKKIKRGEIKCSIIPKVVSIPKIWDMSEKGEILPPKSTYFWPKIPSGILLNKTSFSNL